MAIAGIITEYDPFHAGHAWQIGQAKQRGAEAVAVCMSSDVTQRGGMALLPPWVRAKAAVQAGADLVLALPNPCVVQSAEGFAAAGVAALSALPQLDWLVFGAETPDADALMEVAQMLDTPEFSRLLAEELAQGHSFAKARSNAAARLNPVAGQVLASPNNNLGVEYCKAILKSCSHLVPRPLARKGAAHGQLTPGEEGFASATFVRKTWAEQGVHAVGEYLPPHAFALYQQAHQQGLDPDLVRWQVAILSRLRQKSVAQLAQVRDTAEGLEHRLAAAVRQSGSLEELYTQMKTKRYAHARIRRYVLCAALDYHKDTPGQPAYLQVLAATQKGLQLLRGSKLAADTSLARLARTSAQAAQQVQAHEQASDLTALCRRTPGPMGQCYTAAPYLVR